MSAATERLAPGPEARALYERDGYLAPLDVFAPGEIAAARAAFDALEAEMGREACQTGLQSRHLDLEFVWRLVADPRMLDWIECAMGPDIVLLSCQFFCKYPSPEAREGAPFVAWHQDVTYWGLEPALAHSAWIAIDDVNRDNGAMEVIPGSHRGGIVPHGRSETPGNLLSIEQEIPAEHVDRSRAVALELRAGQASLHHGRLFHASPPNRSASRRRCGLAVRYVTPDVRQVRPNSIGGYWPAVSLRGRPSLHFPERDPPFALP